LLRLGHSGIHFPQPNPGGTHDELDPFKENFKKHTEEKRNLDNKRKENNKTQKKMSRLYVPSKHNFKSLPPPKKKNKPKKSAPRSTSTSKSKSKIREETKSTCKLHVPKLQSIDETRQILSKFENIQG
jgi:hypothetical protein